HIRRVLMGDDHALQGSTQAFALIPGLVGVYIRGAFLALVLDHCDRSATIHFGTTFSQRAARIGPNVYVGPGCHLGRVHLERDVLLAAGVHVPSGPDTHGIADTTRPIREQPGTLRVVTIGEGSWVGSQAVDLADVGRHSVVAAGAVVTEPVGDFVIGGGVPARVLRHRLAQGTGSAPDGQPAASHPATAGAAPPRDR